jgi:four helix bundle protein
MKEDNVIRRKSYEFAVRITRMCKRIRDEEQEFVLSKQVQRSGTSIGANVEEAIGGASRKDFLSKITIAYKEARETKYWLRLLKDCEYVTAEAGAKLLGSVDDLIKILGSIQCSTKLHQKEF